ncbi:hypothetical protein [Halomarina pelagica]|uniref:hypothetical protein n=1 Tax=Halomarina pelagica TaxID=2961599 RepID=UPI0020C29998|nr:hypothetical protein [Halomarina sp. BND7]
MIVAVLLVTAGCIGSTGPEADTERPTESGSVDVTSNVTIHPYPQLPSTLTNETAVEYARTYERAHAQRQALNESQNVSGSLETVQISIETAVATKTADGGYIVRLDYAVGLQIELPDGKVVASDHVVLVDYYLNETTALRAVAPTANGPVPDPRTNGTVIAQRSQN